MKNHFFSKSQKKLCQSNCFTKAHFMNLFRMVFMFKAKLLPYFEKSGKNTFLVTKKPSFLLQFLKKLKFLTKKFIPNLHNWAPKAVYFYPFFFKNPNFSTKIELMSHFYRKTCFFPVFPPFSHYKSTHNKILGKRSKSVSLELYFRPACQFLSNSIPTILRSALFPSK